VRAATRSPYAVEREIEYVEALIAEAGGSARLYGVSSGGAFVLEAAAAGVAVDDARRGARRDGGAAGLTYSRAMTDQREQGILRTARVSWLTRPPHGHAQVSVGSRAFTALPLSFAAEEAEPQVTTPGELLAAAVSGALTLMLGWILERAGTPARELTVTAGVTFAGDWYEIASVELGLHGRVDGIDAAGFEQAAREALRRCGESLGLPAGETVALTAELA